jgi:RNA polymerase sigma-70 factor (ECF subfamily)
MQELNQDNLIERAQRGSQEAVGLLYEQHHSSIYRYTYYRTGNAQAAEDITADVFLKMVQALPGFHGSSPAFRGWLFQIARNLSIDHLRRYIAHPVDYLREDLFAPNSHTENSVDHSLEAQSLHTALNQLNDDQKDVILIRFVEGLPLAETARVLHKSEDSVKGLQRRALEALREYMIEKENNYETTGRNSSRISTTN